MSITSSPSKIADLGWSEHMTSSEHEQKIIEEALRRLRDMDRALGRSQMDLLFQARAHEKLRNISEVNRFIEESLRASAQRPVRNAIEGISISAREAMEKTVAGFHALAVSSLQQAAIEALRVTQISKAHLNAWIGIAAIRNATVHANFVPSLAALESTLPKRTVEHAAQAIAEANRVNISQLGAISGSSALAALDFSKFNDDVKYIRALHNSYSGQLAAALRDLLSSPDISDENLRPIQDLVNSKISSLPQGRISAEGLLTLLLTLISVLIAYGSYKVTGSQTLDPERNSEAQTKQSAQITNLIRQLVINTSRLIPDEDQETYYVVEREAVLRLKPRAKSSSFGFLFPNQKVRMVQRQHKWIYVEYFDEIEGLPKYGWAYKKYFRSTPLSNLNRTLSPYLRSSNKWPEPLNSEERLAITDNWEQTNARRVGLIQKKINNNITLSEERELEILQHLADKRIRLLAPLPIDRFKSILNEVTRSN